MRRKVEKVTKYDRDYIWGLVQDQFRREGFSETASEIAMTDFERIYQYALDNVRFVRRAEVLAEFVFNGLYSVWNNRVRKGGG
ncbi:replication initiator protein A [Streptococcus pneumoniae]|uniref:Replication initiator protein A n=1 Tax=Streptococcus pneumoniae TaxID=1313 RepID=A0A4J1SJH8_STREE|nr:replication initiator protein A [Streptococcus pneumoniae]CZC37200.1 replication initiator protein A [Streptococcus pneumoniae]CZC50478.1 replication initiator protein A [Streptococcus pneumoniae]VIU02743.1 replication initiator protein A [Streptococcus pneumoniae]VJU49521.1 replication initiator protein A [Streptococcus pneumoniae]